MKTREYTATRRSVLAGSATAVLAFMARPIFKKAGSHGEPGITAVPVAQVPGDPEDAAWGRAHPGIVSLSPQNLVLPRLMEAGAKSLNVRALYDNDRLAFLLEWPDAHKDADLGTVMKYRDAVALQFPQDPAGATPSFTMGQKDGPVTIYHWKSDLQFGRQFDVDEAYPNMYGDWYQHSGVGAGQIPEAMDYLTAGRAEYLTAAAVGNALADPRAQGSMGPVQKMRAEGFGTIEPDQTQDAAGRGVWRDGAWKILISVPRTQAKFAVEEGSHLPVAFAVWDGSRNERNGQKAYSVWNTVALAGSLGALADVGEKNGDFGRFVIPWIGSVGGLVLVGVATVLALRFRRSHRERRA